MMEKWKKRSRRGERRVLTVIAVITILIIVALTSIYIWGPKILDNRGSCSEKKSSETVENPETFDEIKTLTPDERFMIDQPETAKESSVSEINLTESNFLMMSVGREKMTFTFATPTPSEEETKH